MIFIRILLTASIKPDNVSDDKYAEFDSEKTIDDLADAIRADGHSVEIVNVGEDIRGILEARKDQIDLVFNVAEGNLGEEREAIVPRICEELNIPFSASGSKTLINTLNKAKTKEILDRNRIPTPRFQVLEEDDEISLDFPLLVKPLFEGSSKGLFNENLVKNESQLKKIVKKIKKDYKQPAIAEEFLQGREFTVSVIGYHNPIVLPIVEIRFDHLPNGIHPMDSYEAKWIYDNPKSGKDPLECPANLDRDLERRIRQIALKTFEVLDCKDWCRIDIRLDKSNMPNVLEVNALPGFMKDPRENSRLPRAAYSAGWSYNRLIKEVLDSAIKRWKRLK